MLIVNADDWGYDQATTDAIATVYEEDRVTSATAMVFMRDSERAARLAPSISIPLGLHLNLMEPFSGPETPEAVRRRQEWVVGRYRANCLSPWLPGRRLFCLSRRCVEDQLDAFSSLYGAGPTHVDGHQHGHMSTSALCVLGGRGNRRIRRTFTFRPSDKPLPNRALRRALNGYVSRRFSSTHGFYSLRRLHSSLGGHGLEAVIAEACHQDIEIMVHPASRDEYEILMSEEWARLLAGVPLGSYRDLIDHHER